MTVNLMVYGLVMGIWLAAAASHPKPGGTKKARGTKKQGDERARSRTAPGFFLLIPACLPLYSPPPRADRATLPPWAVTRNASA